ncbi:MAG: hypothetical protein N2507_05260, partial [Candidatus Bipolaricaulota bacterium]|nr:hypothetical protein [Candidatus Bipolaricaulota bacterium]
DVYKRLCGAWAFDTCCDVTWSYRIDRYEPGCGGTGKYHVTFLARDCAGNEAETKATFTIVDTLPPKWDQAMPGDTGVECPEIPRAPEVTASDTCAGKLSVRFRETRIDGECPCKCTLARTWEATDGCHTLVHTQRIRVQDTTPPDLVVPGDVELGCNPADTSPAATGWATAKDSCGLAGPPT